MKADKISRPLVFQEGKTAKVSSLIILHKGKFANFEKNVPSSGSTCASMGIHSNDRQRRSSVYKNEVAGYRIHCPKRGSIYVWFLSCSVKVSFM
jgi:hypothetical protein